MDVPKLFDHNKDQNGRISRVLYVVLHFDGGADDEDLNEDDGWLDIGPEDPN